MPTFDVLSEPWIPTIDLDGKRREVGMLAALTEAHRIREIKDTSPIVEFGLYRLLVAFLLDALSLAGKAPKNEHDLADLIRTRQFDESLLTRYADHCGAVFDLFDTDRPFLQSSSAQGGLKSIAALYPAVPSGTNASHWHHGDETRMTVSCAEAARLLATIAPFMTAGGAGLSPSINGAPAIYALPMGSSLFETLVLNLPTRRSQDAGSGTVAWREMRPPGGPRLEATMQEALTWRPRLIRLAPDSDEKKSVSRIYFQAGDSTRLEWTDPNLAYRYGKDKTPVRMREGRPLWRDAGPLVLLSRASGGSGEKKFQFQRPDVVEKAFSVQKGEAHIKVYGMRTDMKMKIFEWAASEFRIPSSLGRSQPLCDLVQSELDHAETVAFSLRTAVRNLYPREAAGNKKALGRVVECAERAYWLNLEQQFQRLIEAVAELSEEDCDYPDRVGPKIMPWRESARRFAKEAFESVAIDFDSDSDSLERVVIARMRLNSALRTILL